MADKEKTAAGNSGCQERRKNWLWRRRRKRKQMILPTSPGYFKEIISTKRLVLFLSSFLKKIKFIKSRDTLF